MMNYFNTGWLPNFEVRMSVYQILKQRLVRRYVILYVRSKLLAAAIEADEDYRAVRTKLDKGISSPIIEDNNTRILKKSTGIKSDPARA